MSHTMRISVFTGKKKDSARVQAVQAASAVAAEHGARILILPGSPLEDTRTDGTLFQKLADKNGIALLAEVDEPIAQTYLFRPSNSRLGPFIQHFSQGANADEIAVQTVINEFADRARIIEIANKRIGVLLCGENNILRNVPNLGNAVRPRHPKMDLPLVLFCPERIERKGGRV